MNMKAFEEYFDSGGSVLPFADMSQACRPYHPTKNSSAARSYFDDFLQEQGISDVMDAVATTDIYRRCEPVATV